MCLQSDQQGGLLGCALERSRIRGQSFFRRKPDFRQPDLSTPAFAQCHREHRREHFTDRVVVVGRCPIGKLQQFLRQEREFIQPRDGMLEFVLRHLGGVGDASEQADDLAAPERNPHPHACTERAIVTDGWQVIE